MFFKCYLQKSCLTHFNIPASRHMLSLDKATAVTIVGDSKLRVVWLCLLYEWKPHVLMLSMPKSRLVAVVSRLKFSTWKLLQFSKYLDIWVWNNAVARPQFCVSNTNVQIAYKRFIQNKNQTKSEHKNQKIKSKINQKLKKLLYLVKFLLLYSPFLSCKLDDEI